MLLTSISISIYTQPEKQKTAKQQMFRSHSHFWSKESKAGNFPFVLCNIINPVLFLALALQRENI
jgi:hypothetical protein